MSWTNYPIQVGDSMVDDNVKEIWEGYRERVMALYTLGGGEPAIPVAGESPLLLRSEIVTIMTWIQANCHHFVKRPAGGWGTNHHGQASIVMWDWDTLRADVGVNTSVPTGWSRYYERYITALTDVTYADGDAVANGHKARFRSVGTPENGYVYTRTGGVWTNPVYGIMPDIVLKYGLPEIGDIFTSVMCNEIYRCLDQMRWSKGGGGFLYTGGGSNDYEGTGQDSTYAAAKTAATADYAGVLDASEGPRAWSLGAHATGPLFTSDLYRTISHAAVTGLLVQIAGSLEFYVKATSPTIPGGASGSQVFDDNGDPVLQNQYALLETFAMTPDVLNPNQDFDGTIALGTNAAPEFADTPVVLDQVNVKGWVVATSDSIAKWSFVRMS